MMLAGASAVTLAGLVLLTSCGSPGRQRVGPYDEALRQVNERRGQLAWDGIVTGMTREQVEQAVGQRLESPTGPGPLCGRYTTETTVLGQPLELSFGGPTQGARLESLTVLLPAPPGGFQRDEVVPALEARLGELEFIPSRHAPERGEDEIRKPLYRSSGGGLVFVNPNRGVSLGNVCYD